MTSLIKEEHRDHRTDPIYDKENKDFIRFKEWIRKTSLFNAIVQDSGTGITIAAFTEQETMELRMTGKKITKVEELPFAIVLKFYENSPWCNKLPNINKLIENGKSDTNKDQTAIS